MVRTVVIGGGVAGLASATLLAQEGHSVTLFERHERVGGRAGTLERDGFRFDTGPSWYLMPSAFDHFFQLLGTSTREQLDLRRLDPGYRVFTEPDAQGERAPAVTVPAGAHAVRALFERLEPGSAQRVDEYLASAREAADFAERYFLYNPFTRLGKLATPELIKRVPHLTRLLSQSLETWVNERFCHPVLRQILQYPAVFLGTSPAEAPAMYHLMSALDLDQGVQYPMGGFWQFVSRLERLAIEAGVEIVTDAEVTGINTHRRRVQSITWRRRAEHVALADVVVSAADLHHTETQLLVRADQSYPEEWWEKKKSGPGAIIVMLGVEGKLPQLPHHSLFFTTDWQSNFEAIFGANTRVPDPASVYVCKPSATDAGVAPKGCENLFVLVPVPADTDLGHGGPDGTGDGLVEMVADRVIDQVAGWAGIHDLRSRIRVRHTLGPADFADDYASWRGGMLGPAHTLTQSALFRPQNQSRRVKGLYYAGATTAPGVGVPMCLISAELVLKRIRGDHSPGPMPVSRHHAAPVRA